MNDWEVFLRNELPQPFVGWEISRLEVDVGKTSALAPGAQKLSGQVHDTTVRELLCLSATIGAAEGGHGPSKLEALRRLHGYLSRLYHVPLGSGDGGHSDGDGGSGANNTIPLPLPSMRRWTKEARPPLLPVRERRASAPGRNTRASRAALSSAGRAAALSSR